MPLEFFSLASLLDMDGGANAIKFDHLLDAALFDMEDRPGEPTPRKIIMTLKLTPVSDERGNLVGVRPQFIFEGKAPKFESKEYDCGIRMQGERRRMVFSKHSPSNLQQYTIDDMDSETGQVDRSEPEDDQSAA